MPKKQLVAEALIDLHRRLSTLPARMLLATLFMESIGEKMDRKFNEGGSAPYTCVA